MQNQKLKRLKILSSTLDSKFQGPFGLKFGLDPLIGLIPVVGDWITAGMSIFIISEAASMGVAPATLVRMGINIAIENVIDMIPVVGNLFDFYWKANDRNMKLLDQHLLNPPRETIKSRMIVALICVSLILLMLGTGYVAFIVIEALFDWITSLSVN